MGEVALRKIQAAIEATRGLDLAATRKVYAKGMMTKDIVLLRPEEDRGTFIKNYRSALGVVTAAFPITGGLTYEDLPWYSQLAIKGCRDLIGGRHHRPALGLRSHRGGRRPADGDLRVGR